MLERSNPSYPVCGILLVLLASASAKGGFLGDTPRGHRGAGRLGVGYLLARVAVLVALRHYVSPSRLLSNPSARLRREDSASR
ncbi:MAG: hypothetical protein ACRDP1_03375 [Nocardioidaceae bacterium]